MLINSALFTQIDLECSDAFVEMLVKVTSKATIYFCYDPLGLQRKTRVYDIAVFSP